MSATWMTTAEAGEELGVTRPMVRKSRGSVPGRNWSEQTSWAALFLLSGDVPRWIDANARNRLKTRIRSMGAAHRINRRYGHSPAPRDRGSNDWQNAACPGELGHEVEHSLDQNALAHRFLRGREQVDVIIALWPTPWQPPVNLTHTSCVRPAGSGVSTQNTASMLQLPMAGSAEYAIPQGISYAICP